MRKIIYCIGLIFFLSSCYKELDISSVQQRKRLVVNALLNDEDALRIWVSQSTGFSDSVPPGPLTNANVKVRDESGNITVCTFNLGSKYYESSLVPESGRKYTIEVQEPNFPNAVAQVQIPSKANSQKSDWKDSTSFDTAGFPLGTITVHMDDNGSVKNYYRLALYYYDNIAAEWVVLSANPKDAELENNAIRTADGALIFSDQTFNGKKKDLGFIAPFGFSTQSPKFLVITENLSDEYYKYFKSLDDYRNSGGLFSEPSGVYTNITNGLGIAAGSSIQRDTIQ